MCTNETRFYNSTGTSSSIDVDDSLHGGEQDESLATVACTKHRPQHWKHVDFSEWKVFLQEAKRSRGALEDHHNGMEYDNLQSDSDIVRTYSMPTGRGGECERWPLQVSFNTGLFPMNFIKILFQNRKYLHTLTLLLALTLKSFPSQIYIACVSMIHASSLSKHNSYKYMLVH